MTGIWYGRGCARCGLEFLTQHALQRVCGACIASLAPRGRTLIEHIAAEMSAGTREAMAEPIPWEGEVA